MKMKMNKNKKMLALLVVAALALCSVAVIADESSDSSASSTSYTFLSGDVTIDSTMASTNIFIYGDAGSVTIPSTVTYSGTISFGYYYPGTGVYVACDTITLSSASDMIVSYDGDLEISADSVDGLTVTLGTVTLGISDSSGTVTAGDATLVLDDAYGLEVTVSSNGNTYLSGSLVDGTVTVSGTAYTKDLTIGSAATLIVADGATVTTAADVDAAYEIVIGYTGSSTVSAATLGSYVATIDAVNKTLSFTNVVSNDYELTISMNYVIGDETVSYTIVCGVAVNEYGSYYVTDLYLVSTTSGTATYSSSLETYSVSIVSTSVGSGHESIAIYDDEGALVTYTTTYTYGTNSTTAKISGLDAGTYYLAITMGSGATTVLEKLVVTAGSSSGNGTFTLSQVDSVTSVASGTATATYTITVDVTTGFDLGAVTVKVDEVEVEAVNTYSSGVNSIQLTGVPLGSNSIVIEYTETYSGDSNTVTIDGTITVTSSGYSATISNDNSVSISAAFDSSSSASTNFELTASEELLVIYTAGTSSAVASGSSYVYDVPVDSATSVKYYVYVTDSAYNVVHVYVLTYSGSTWSYSDTMSFSGDIDSASDTTVTVNGTLYVLGSMSVTYNDSTDAYNAITGSGYIYVAEYIDDDDTVTAYNNATLKVESETRSVLSIANAVYYYNSTASTSNPYYTYTYTSMTNALANSAYVYVIGTYYIVGDITLETSVSGATSTIVTVNSGSNLVIGTADSSVIVTVPSTTSLALTSNSSAPVHVVSGELMIAGETSDRGTSKISAEVFITNSTYGIYADLSTALANAVSGDIVSLRQNAEILANTELADGVTLKLVGFDLYIGDYTGDYTPVFTVNGTIVGTSTSSYVVIYEGATVEANTSDATTDKYTYVVYGGELDIGSDATIATVDILIFGGEFNIAGTVTSDVVLDEELTLTIDGYDVPMTLINDVTIDVSGIFTMTSDFVTADGTEYGITVVVEDAGVLNAFSILNYGDGDLIITVEGELIAAENSGLADYGEGDFTLVVSGTVSSYSDDDVDYVLNVVYADDIYVTGTLSVGNVSVDTMDVSGGTFTATISSYITYLIVTDDGNVIPDGTGVYIYVYSAVIGDAPTTIATYTNASDVSIVVYEYAIVYGTAADVDIDADYSALLYTVGANANYIYATEYANDIEEYLVLDTITGVSGYSFLGWYYDASGTSVVSGAKFGSVTSVYGLFNAVTYTLTLTYAQGVDWVLDGVVVSGTVQVTSGTHTLTAVAQSGYQGTAKITASGNATYSGTTLTVTGAASVSATGITEKNDNNSIIDILLIIIVIVIVILAIVVVLRMLRS
jgi:hypothetical protein